MAETNVDRVLMKWGDIMVRLTQSRIRKGRPPYGDKNATGEMSNSLGWRYSRSSTQRTLQLVGNTTFGYVQRGVAPGSYTKRNNKGRIIGPPINKLINWIKIKRIPIWGSRPAGQKYARGSKPTNDQVRGMAYQIQSNIIKHGIKPFDMLSAAKKINENPRFKRELAEAIKLDLIKQINPKLINQTLRIPKLAQ